MVLSVTEIDHVKKVIEVTNRGCKSIQKGWFISSRRLEIQTTNFIA